MNTQNFFKFRPIWQRKSGIAESSVKLKHSPGMYYTIVEVYQT